MVPTSTHARIQLSTSAPTKAEAWAVFVHKQSKRSDAYPLLSEAQQTALNRVLAAGLLRGKSNEVSIQLMDGGPRLILVGMGNRDQYPIECLREAGAALAKAARRHRIDSVAVFPPEIRDALRAFPGIWKVEDAPAIGIAALVEGLVVGSFEYKEYYGTAKNGSDGPKSRDIAFTILAAPGSQKELSAAVRRLPEDLLRLGVIPSLGPYLLPRIVVPLRRTHPQLRLLWHDDTMKELLTRLTALNAAASASPTTAPRR